MAGPHRKKLGSVAIAVGFALFAWFVLEFFQEDWQGTGNPMWLAFMGALALNAVGRGLIRGPRTGRSRRAMD